MCLAVPGRVIETQGDNAWVDFQGNRLRICTVLTPEADAGDWVLVHAGFAITTVNEAAARRTWDYLNTMNDGERSGALQEAGDAR